MLSPLQERIARLVPDLPEADGFALAGAAALLVRGYIDRTTRDLDYFTTPERQDRVQLLAGALQRALAAEGLEATRFRDLPAFVRLVVSGELGEAEVDLAIDYRALDVQPTSYGPTLAPEELAANKVLAIFDRAEARDFTDLAALSTEFRLADLMDLAARKDLGFEPRRFLEALRSFRRFTAGDLELTAAEHARLRATVEVWCRQVERALEQQTGRPGPDIKP